MISNDMKVGFLLTARMKSTRLKNKLTLKINHRQIIRLMIDRIKLVKNIDEIIICTSMNTQDDILEEIAKEEKIGVFRGHEDDVIERLYGATQQYKLDYALNITADCPLVSFEYIDKIIAKYKETGADLIRTFGLAHGFFSYGMKVEALKKVCEIKKGTDTEVWGKYFTDTGLFEIYDFDIPENLQRPDYRLTLDYPKDFEFFKKIYTRFGKDTYKTPMKDIIDFLDENAEIVQINKDMKQKYQVNWDSQNKLELK